MVWPNRVLVLAPIADVRAHPDDGAELVDQVHHGMNVRVLGERDGWHYIQTEDHWGGTTALGIDCSGYVQQVYRLNGIRLDRDAQQQVMEGRSVDVPAAGDLIFFGDDAITHVALATGERTFLNAPYAGRKVERGELPAAGRTVRAIRRYLP